VRFTLDGSWQRFGRVVIAGSPLTIFRVTEAGARAVDQIERGTGVPRSSLTDRMLDAGAIHPEFGGGTDPTEVSASPAPTAVTIVTPQLGGDVHRDGRITVDDGSVPPLTGAAIRLDVNRGPAAARNAARPMIETEFVAFVDADVRVDAHRWIDDLLPHFADPAVGLVAPRVLGEDGSSLDMGAAPARVRAGTRVSYVPTAAVLVRVAALDEVGWFDERLRFGEDVDLVWRLDESGWRCRYDPGVSVWHEPRHSLAGALRQQIEYGSSAAPLAVRHPGALAPFRSNGWTAGALALSVGGSPATGVLLALGSAAALPKKLPSIPTSAAFELALRGHAAAAEQFAAAIRRAWWPILTVAALRSRRARWLAIAAVAAAPTTALRDVAYGLGVWKGVLRHRTLDPLLPQLTSWPGHRRPRR
jgi:mycofactocin system glycosyltransferase